MTRWGKAKSDFWWQGGEGGQAKSDFAWQGGMGDPDPPPPKKMTSFYEQRRTSNVLPQLLK